MENPYIHIAYFLFKIKYFEDPSLYQRLCIIQKCHDITSNKEKKKYWKQKIKDLFYYYLPICAKL